MNSRLHLWAVVVLGAAAAAPVPAAELSIWAWQEDLREAAGNPGVSLAPLGLAYNPGSGRLLIACGGSNASILEWEHGSTNGLLLVPRANWGFADNPAPYAAAWVPARGAYLVEDGGGDDLIREVLPGVTGQTPPAFVTMAYPKFPAGGLPVDGTYAYYKNQWTGIQQTINRFTLTGTNGVEEEYIPKAKFDAWYSSGPSQEFALDTAGRLIVSLRPMTGFNAYRGVYRWDPDADSNGSFVPIVQEAQITAYTGQNNTTIYGLTVDGRDNIYFYEIYAGAILRVNPQGELSTVVTGTEVRTFLNDAGMQFTSQFMVVANNRLIFTTGNVSGHVLAARLPLDVETVTIPGTDYEVDGPTYPYAIGKYEITNAQYCVFLNDAQLVQQSNPADPRCTNFWIEPATGDVYMTDVTLYPPGSEWYDRTLYKTSDFPDSKIKYAAGNAVGTRFYVLPGFHNHPVGTVTWYGAAKFCNWLTIDAGLGATELCYHEGPNKLDWYAITATDYSTNGLLESERLDLVRNYRGYRLPMDGVNVDNGGPGVATSWNMAANPFNEWYKAAAFDPAAPDTQRPGPGDAEVVQPDHWIYGFGADTITAVDANRHNTGYPGWETTPVGWYDGVNLLFDGTPTVDTRNPYGLYDMCGNMSEWNNDTALEAPWGASFRAARGGSWSNSDPKYVTNSVRTICSARYYAENSLGFRIARSFGFGDFDADGDVDLGDYELLAAALTGPAVPITPGLGHEACDYDGDGHVDLWDMARFQATFDTLP